MVSQGCDGTAGGEAGREVQTHVSMLDWDEQGLDHLSTKDLGNEFSAPSAVVDRAKRKDQSKGELRGGSIIIIISF